MAQRVPKAKTFEEAKPRAVSREEARQMYDEMARELFDMSADEWVRRYDAGGFDENIENWDVVTMEMLLPMYREIRIDAT